MLTSLRNRVPLHEDGIAMRQLLRRAWYAVRHRQFHSLLADELDFHRAMKQRELEQQGLDPPDAALATRQALGSVALAHDHARDVWIWPWLQDTCQDIRFAVRLLAKDRRFTVVAVLTLTLGIGASTVMFSLVYALVFDAFPYRNP